MEIETIEEIKNKFLTELLNNPIDFYYIFPEIRSGYVQPDYYYQKLNINELEFIELIEDIFNEGYIAKTVETKIIDGNPEHNTVDVTIKLKGRIFLKNGGYIQQKIDINKLKEEQRIIAQKQIDGDDRMGNLTFWLSFGTIGLLIFSVLNWIWDNFLKNHCHH